MSLTMTMPTPMKSPFRPQHQLPPRRPTFEPGDKADFTEMNKILRELGSILDPNDDIAALQDAEKWIEMREENCANEVERLEVENRVLAKALEEASLRTLRPSHVPSSIQHEAELQTLEDKHLTVGKQVNEEADRAGKKEQEAVRLREDRKAWEGRDVVVEEGKEMRKKGAGLALRLKLFTDAGFTLAGADRLLIRNDTKDDVHSVVVDTHKSKFYNANLFWNLASD